MKKKLSLKQFSHAWILSYFFIYVVWFFYINQKSLDSFHTVETGLDALIPFNEWFIFPYYIWFFYVPVAVAYFFFTSREEFYRICMFLFIGMTVCLVAYTVYPTGVYFRPDLDQLGRNNIAIQLTKIIYTADVGTNVWPSIHCYNSIGIAVAVLKCNRLNQKRWLTLLCVGLSMAICMSTMLVKQHSILDFYAAVGLSVVMYVVAYVPKYDKLFRKIRNKPEIITLSKLPQRPSKKKLNRKPVYGNTEIRKDEQ